MGMMIDEIVETLSDMQMTDETLYSHLSDTDKHLIDKRNTSLKRAIGIITKYQKIEQIIADWRSDGGAFEMSEPYWLRLISEVIEDGKVD